MSDFAFKTEISLKDGMSAPLSQIADNAKKLSNSVPGLVDGIRQAESAMIRLPDHSNRTTESLTNLSRIVQDAPFGFIGVANNISPMIESFGRLKKETGSAGGAFKALLSGLSGPGGMILGVGALSAAMSLMPSIISAVGGAFGKAKFDLEAFNKALSNTEAIEAQIEKGRELIEQLKTLRGELSKPLKQTVDTASFGLAKSKMQETAELIKSLKKEGIKLFETDELSDQQKNFIGLINDYGEAVKRAVNLELDALRAVEVNGMKLDNYTIQQRLKNRMDAIKRTVNIANPDLFGKIDSSDFEKQIKDLVSTYRKEFEILAKEKQLALAIPEGILNMERNFQGQTRTVKEIIEAFIKLPEAVKNAEKTSKGSAKQIKEDWGDVEAYIRSEAVKTGDLFLSMNTRRLEQKKGFIELERTEELRLYEDVRKMFVKHNQDLAFEAEKQRFVYQENGKAVLNEEEAKNKMLYEAARRANLQLQRLADERFEKEFQSAQENRAKLEELLNQDAQTAGKTSVYQVSLQFNGKEWQMMERELDIHEQAMERLSKIQYDPFSSLYDKVDLIDTVNDRLMTMNDFMSNQGVAAIEALGSGFSDAFFSIGQGTFSLGESAKAMAASYLKSLSQMAAQQGMFYLAKYIGSWGADVNSLKAAGIMLGVAAASGIAAGAASPGAPKEKPVRQAGNQEGSTSTSNITMNVYGNMYKDRAEEIEKNMEYLGKKLNARSY